MSAEHEPIRRFLAGHLNGHEIGDDTDIFATGYVNSLFAVQLVMWIERTYGCTLSGADLVFENVNTVNHIAAFVRDKQAAAAVKGGGPAQAPAGR